MKSSLRCRCAILALIMMTALAAKGTTVTATLIDPSGQVLSNSFVRAEFVPAPGTTGSPTIASVSATTDASGIFNIALTDVNTINPKGGTWTFTVCPNATVNCSIISKVVITGSTQDVSTTLNAGIPTINVTAQTLLPRAYKDTEVPTTALSNVGAMYWNNIDKTLHMWDGQAWNTSQTDNTAVVLNPVLLGTGTDACAQISSTFAFGQSAGWTSLIVDARRRNYIGLQHCAGSPFAGVLNNGTVTGYLLLSGTQLVMDTSIIVPGGFHINGNAPRGLVSPSRNFAGTSIQPSSTYNWATSGPLVQLGSSTDTSSPQGVMVENLAIGGLPPGGTYVAGVTPPSGSTCLFNGNAQEMSGAQFIQFQNCPVTYDVEQLSASPVHSGFDSFGLKHSTIVMPYDDAAIGIECGGSLNGGIAGLAHVNGFEDNTITGTPCSGATCSNGVGGTASVPLAAKGVAIDINCSDTAVRGNRYAYVNIPVRIGQTNSAQNVHTDMVDVTSNNSNAWSIIVDMEAHADHTENIENILASGPGVAGGLILKDVNYPNATCSLVQNNASTGDNGENSLTHYVRGIGGGVNGIVISSARTGCTTTANAFAGLLAANNIWTGTNTFNQNITLSAQGTATAVANFPSRRTNYFASVWNGVAATNCAMGWDVNPGTGTNPTQTLKLEVCPTAAANNLDLSSLSTNGITFAPGTYKTNSVANAVQNGFNLNTGTGVTVTNTSSANVQVNVSNPPATLSNCASAASPAVCGSAASGVVTMPIGATLVTVNTSAVTANSRIFLTYDHSTLSNTQLGVTCSTATATENAMYVLHDKSAGNSFTIHTNTAPSGNPGCIQYSIVN